LLSLLLALGEREFEPAYSGSLIIECLLERRRLGLVRLAHGVCGGARLRALLAQLSLGALTLALCVSARYS
jgi:hypothetical protein